MFLLSYLCHTPCFFYPCLPSTCQIKVSHKPLLNKGSVLGKEKRRKSRTWLNGRHLIWENGFMNFSQRIGCFQNKNCLVFFFLSVNGLGQNHEQEDDFFSLKLGSFSTERYPLLPNEAKSHLLFYI